MTLSAEYCVAHSGADAETRSVCSDCRAQAQHASSEPVQPLLWDIILYKPHDLVGEVCAAIQEQIQKRDRSAQIADHRRSMQALDRCNLCFGSAARQRHLTISLGQTSYLALPAK